MEPIEKSQAIKVASDGPEPNQMFSYATKTVLDQTNQPVINKEYGAELRNQSFHLNADFSKLPAYPAVELPAEVINENDFNKSVYIISEPILDLAQNNVG